MNPVKIELFVSRESATYEFTVRQVQDVCERVRQSGKVDCRLEVIHVEDDPDAAERNDIEALPTLLVGSRRFVGTPTAEFVDTIEGLLMAEQDSPSAE
jgi:hypothetical protein